MTEQETPFVVVSPKDLIGVPAAGVKGVVFAAINGHFIIGFISDAGCISAPMPIAPLVAEEGA